jgi:nucleoside-diphosphate-sugar epimerase
LRVLVTGSKGYIGSVLVDVLRDGRYDVAGLDAGYFVPCELPGTIENYPFRQKDIRDVTRSDIEGFDAIVHLAALSNDPLGELAPNLTEEINLNGTIRLAEIAKEAGIGRFIYSSSQSMYGIASGDEPIDEDDSEKRPLTAYARTKWEAEMALMELDSPSFQIVCFRPSTVFGASPRLRCDIVFNNLVSCAYTTKKIEVKSDGTPWRPVVHVRDVCAAYVAGLEAPEDLVAGRAFNVGIPNGNFTVRDLAEAAQAVVSGSSLVFTGEHGSDSRTYRVSFDRILNDLKEYYRPTWSLQRGGEELVQAFVRGSFTEEDFRGPAFSRLIKIQEHIAMGRLDENLRWT